MLSSYEKHCRVSSSYSFYRICIKWDLFSTGFITSTLQTEERAIPNDVRRTDFICPNEFPNNLLNQ